jgi:twinkle protein
LNIVPNDIDFEKYRVIDDDAARVQVAGAYAAQVMDNFNGPKSNLGLSLPWDEQKAFVRMRPEKVSLWTGVTHHGKSTALSHVMVHAIAQGERVCIWSGEERPDVTLETMVVQATCVAEPSNALIGDYLAHVGPNLWFYDQLGVVPAKRLLGVMAYVTQEHGITQFVIDSLMKTAVRGDDYDGQKDFVNELAALGRLTGCHVHLVAHMRKGRDESLGSIMDVKGAGEIIGQVDNIFTVWKNQPKIEEAAKMNPDPKIMSEADTVHVVGKQRGRKTWTGKFNLTYHQREMQFTRRHAEPKRYYVPNIKAVEMPL